MKEFIQKKANKIIKIVLDKEWYLQDREKVENMYELYDFKVLGDHTGSLVALENGEAFPFDIKRVYYIWGTDKNVVRGKHAHR